MSTNSVLTRCKVRYFHVTPLVLAMSTNSVLTRCEQRAVHFFQRNLQLNIHLSSYNSCFFKPDSCFSKDIPVAPQLWCNCLTAVGQRECPLEKQKSGTLKRI